MMDDARWTQYAPSEYAGEGSALAYLKSVIPDREPYRAWANAEFIGADGSVNEIDLLLIAPAGIILVEVKSWSGVLMGDAGTWQLDHRARVDNPVIGANRKARMLKSLLAAQPSLRGRRLPRVDGIVFLSEPTLDVQLMPEGRANVYGPTEQRALPSISEYLIKPGLVDASLGRAIERAIGEAGIHEPQRAPAALRLYVSAPSDLDLRPLLDGLKRRGAEPYVLSDVAPLGTEILHSLRLALQGADRVLVVLGEARAPNPMFEAGLALGLGKPLLIIAAPGATVPADLAGQVIVRARRRPRCDQLRARSGPGTCNAGNPPHSWAGRPPARGRRSRPATGQAGHVGPHGSVLDRHPCRGDRSERQRRRRQHRARPWVRSRCLVR